MAVYASVSGELSIPSDPHPDDERYEPVAKGKPLCVEILHWAFGNVQDWYGNAELLSASWAALGGGAKPGPRLVHFIRNDIEPFTFLSQLGADDYFHRLVFYTPAYDGRELRLTLQYVELDKNMSKHLDAIGEALTGLGRLPVFAAQLPFLVALPGAVDVGRRLYNLVNRNDRILTVKMDFRLDDDDFYRLTSGRYVALGESHRPEVFVDKYRLATSGVNRNRLVTQEGAPADEEVGSPYFVFRIDARERAEYEDFEMDSAAQEVVEAVLNGGDLTEDAADLISDAVKAASKYRTVAEILRQKDALERAGEDEERSNEATEALRALLKRVSDQNQRNLLTDVLGLGEIVEDQQP